MSEHAELSEMLAAITTYLCDRGLLSHWMKSKIRLSRSRKASSNNEASPRSFCFVILGEHKIHYADALYALPDTAICGILLHEVAHMLIDENGGDPELGVDEWVLENVPEAGYGYMDTTYADPETGRRRTAKAIESVSRKFLTEIGI